jgi:fatty acid desaturase
MIPPKDDPVPNSAIRNWLTILTAYCYIACVVLAALWFFRWREGHVPWWTDFPVAFLAMGLIGPAQHRLWILGQEAALGCLFRNRWLNELVGDWLIHFPFSSATQHVRVQLLSHYEYPNDPERDAERVIMARSGFWPLLYGRLLRLSALLKWNSLRANYNFEQNLNNPYYDPERPPSRVALKLGTAYVGVMFAFLLGLYFRPKIGWMESLPGTDVLLTWVPLVMWIGAMVLFGLLPADKYYRGKLPTVYSPKTMTLMRITFITIVNLALGWSSYLTGRSAVLNYIALWMGPMFTVTSALMLIRQWRQHGEAPVGEATDRHPGLLGRWLLFPMNQHRQQAKHRSPNTPWYLLP